MIALTLFAALIASPPETSANAVAPIVTPPAATEEPPHDPEGIVLPEGFVWDEWAREPLVPDPVAFTILPDGSLYVCESERQDRGVEDNRYSPYWLLEDLACTTVEQRRAIYEKWAAKKEGGMDWYSKWADRVRRLRDTDHNGTADQSTNFSGDLREVLDGTAAGALQVGDALWVTSIPHVWRFVDQDGDGVAEVREKLFTGFGVKTSLRGHDMHGLVQGPDGRIYWSIGDRGYSVRTREGTLLADPSTGAVFRCETDGSHLEVIHRGLRNPQELAFNDLGDLFTVDNNSDGDDKARVCLIQDGGESGWFMPLQTLEGDNKRGPWNQEHMWHTFDSTDLVQPAWITPPLAHLTSGPSGLAAYPGTGFPSDFDGSFLVCDFLGGDSYSQVWRFGVRPTGAGYEMVDPQIFIKNVLPTDVEFSPDGKLYVSDWWNGWQSDGKGRIYRVWHPQAAAKPAATEAIRLLAEGFEKQSDATLFSLLSHDDRRLRQGAHLQLAHRALATGDRLALLLRDTTTPLRVRLHALWALQVISRTSADPSAASKACTALCDACQSEQEEIRAQAARALGDATCRGAAEAVRSLATDESTRVRAMACGALGRLKDTASLAELTAVLWENEDKDPWLRHAAATALARIGDRVAIQTLAMDPSPQVRMGAAIALRQLKDPAIERLLFDPDPRIAIEAARAIYDLPIGSAMPALASLGDRFVEGASKADIGSFTIDDVRLLPLLRRVIGANRLSADPAAAARLAGLAQSSKVPAAARVLAIEALAEWAAPGPREPVSGAIVMVDPAARDVVAWKSLLAIRLPDLSAHASDESVRTRARAMADQLGIVMDSGAALRTALDPHASVGERIACLSQLERGGGEALRQALAASLNAPEWPLRSAALTILSRTDPVDALARISRVLAGAEVAEQQAAIQLLANMKSDSSRDLIRGLADQLLAGTLSPALQLEVIDACAACGVYPNELRQFKAARPANNSFDECLDGGDSSRGKRIVVGHVSAQCLRCHALAGAGGVAGPSLEGVATRHNRNALLESLVNPNAHIAAGFGPTSAMPNMSALLTPREIRDVVEYLSTLKAGQ